MQYRKVISCDFVADNIWLTATLFVRDKYMHTHMHFLVKFYELRKRT